MQWHQLDHMQTICTSLQTDNHINISSLKFFKPDALPDAQPTVPKHWTQTHTHTRLFNGPLSGTTRVSWYQKSIINLDFTEARDSEWQWHQLSHMQTICTSLQTDNHINISSLKFFFKPDALPDAQPTVPKHWTRTHTHTRLFNGPLSVTTRVSWYSWYQKSIINLGPDFQNFLRRS